MSKVLFVISPTLNSFADSRKGTTGNRIDCAMQHFANSAISNAEIAAVAGTTALIGRSAFNSAVKKAPELAKELEGKGVVKKFIKYFSSAPKAVKIASAALMGLSLLHRTYKKGTIEQKYIDRAQFVDRTFQEEKQPLASAAMKKDAPKKA